MAISSWKREFISRMMREGHTLEEVEVRIYDYRDRYTAIRNALKERCPHKCVTNVAGFPALMEEQKTETGYRFVVLTHERKVRKNENFKNKRSFIESALS